MRISRERVRISPRMTSTCLWLRRHSRHSGQTLIMHISLISFGKAVEPLSIIWSIASAIPPFIRLHQIAMGSDLFILYLLFLYCYSMAEFMGRRNPSMSWRRNDGPPAAAESAGGVSCRFPRQRVLCPVDPAVENGFLENNYQLPARKISHKAAVSQRNGCRRKQCAKAGMFRWKKIKNPALPWGTPY